MTSIITRPSFGQFQVQKINIGNESRGPGHGIFVEEIEVAAPNEEAAIFPCKCWLAEDEGDGKTARALEPGETVSPPYDSKYKLLNSSQLVGLMVQRMIPAKLGGI